MLPLLRKGAAALLRHWRDAGTANGPVSRLVTDLASLGGLGVPYERVWPLVALLAHLLRERASDLDTKYVMALQRDTCSWLLCCTASKPAQNVNISCSVGWHRLGHCDKPHLTCAPLQAGEHGGGSSDKARHTAICGAAAAAHMP